MPMNVGFRWKGVNIAPPKTVTERERLGENLGAIGDAITQVKRAQIEKDEREYRRNRNAELDRINAEDRQRRIDEEERQKRLFGDTAGLIRGKADERARLVQKREQIAAQIEALKQRIGM